MLSVGDTAEFETRAAEKGHGDPIVALLYGAKGSGSPI
jgi:hypothetical protein